jgi:hypothetical protein
VAERFALGVEENVNAVDWLLQPVRDLLGSDVLSSEHNELVSRQTKNNRHTQGTLSILKMTFPVLLFERDDEVDTSSAFLPP